ncbi:MAG: biotin--[acetyl-CoA-carboxylase] ligase [Chitinispirillia bacterium]|jgi:BirA family biotin operon repressor/biotin-[acetyl-CoA-carboxylase] ligase
MENPIRIKPDKNFYTIYKYDELESTNNFIKNNIESLKDYTVIWGNKQSSGRGRFSRKWISIGGKDLTFSILLPLSSLKPCNWPNTTQITALCIAELLEDYMRSVRIKWPNDILVNNKKICGILCEIIKRKRSNGVIVGIGLNVNSSAHDLSCIDQPATSIWCESCIEMNRQELLIKLIDRFLHSFSILAQHGFSFFKNKISEKLAFKKRDIVLSEGEKKYSGRIIDIDDNGSLKFLCSNGIIRNFYSGELSTFS